MGITITFPISANYNFTNELRLQIHIQALIHWHYRLGTGPYIQHTSHVAIFTRAKKIGKPSIEGNRKTKEIINHTIGEPKPHVTINLQTRAVNDLEVDNELTATVVDDKGTDGATAVGKGITDALEQVALGDDGQTLLDIAGLGHGDELAVVTEVEDAVGLVNGAQHGLDNDGGRGVGDEAGLLLQLAGEQVHTEVAVLAGLGRHGDPDDLAGTALQDQDVANADEVAGDGDGLAGGTAAAGLDDADVLTDAVAEAGRAALVSGDDLLAVVVVEGVHDAVGGALNTTAEGVVLALVVVVAHLAWCVTDSGLDLGRGGVVARSRRLGGFDLERVAVALVEGLGLGLVGAVVRDVDGLGRGVLVVYGFLVVTVVGDVELGVGRGPATVISLGDVELVLDGLVVDLTVLEANRGLVVGVAEREKGVSRD